MDLGNKYEGGGCFAITVTEIGRTGGMGKLLYVYTQPTVKPTASPPPFALPVYAMYKLLLRADSGNIVFKTIGAGRQVPNQNIGTYMLHRYTPIYNSCRYQLCGPVVKIFFNRHYLYNNNMQLLRPLVYTFYIHTNKYIFIIILQCKTIFILR